MPFTHPNLTNRTAVLDLKLDAAQAVVADANKI